MNAGRIFALFLLGAALMAACGGPAMTQPAIEQQVAQMPAPTEAPAAAQAAQPCKPVAKKEIKDPAEYNAYTTSLNAADPNAKIAGFEKGTGMYINAVAPEQAAKELSE